MRLQKRKNWYFVTIPIGIIRSLGWEKGDDLIIQLDVNRPGVLKLVEFRKAFDLEKQLQKKNILKEMGL